MRQMLRWCLLDFGILGINMQRIMVFWAVTAFVIDQLSKYIVVFYFDLKSVLYIDVLPPFINFAMAWNYGVNFGLFASSSDLQRWVLILLALLITGFVLFWLRRDPPTYLGYVGAGLLIGGALGNVVDRLIYGAVADFLNVSCCGIQNRYSFNVADVAIFIGAIALAFFGSRKHKN